jgi:hypothetical protein
MDFTKIYEIQDEARWFEYIKIGHMQRLQNLKTNDNIKSWYATAWANLYLSKLLWLLWLPFTQSSYKDDAIFLNHKLQHISTYSKSSPLNTAKLNHVSRSENVI